MFVTKLLDQVIHPSALSEVERWQYIAPHQGSHEASPRYVALQVPTIDWRELNPVVVAKSWSINWSQKQRA